MNERRKYTPDSGSSVSTAVERVTGKRIIDMSFPGGTSRKTVRCLLDGGQTVMATQRRTEARSKLEADTMWALTKAQAPAPLILGYEAGVLVQQDLGDLRLTQALAAATSDGARLQLLSRAINALDYCKNAISASSVSDRLPLKGDDPRWLRRFVGVSSNVSRLLKIEAPEINIEEMMARLTIRAPSVVKWDARPGNAIVDADGDVYWIDWDYAGRRNSVDDLAWLLCDEYIDVSQVAEAILLRTHLADSVSRSQSEDVYGYLRTFGALHFCVRLELILEHRLKSVDWWDFDHCIASDKVGVTRECALRVCRRGVTWSGANWGTLPLCAWFEQAGKRILEI